MKIETTIDQELKLRIHSVNGHINANDLKLSITEIYEDPEHNPEMNAIWDLRNADLSTMETNDIQALRDLVVKLWGMEESRRAALIVSRDLEFGLSRMFEMLLREEVSGKVMIFRNYDEAVKWIKKESSD